MPDESEDMALKDMASQLSDAGHGMKLGPCANGLAGKVASSKLSAGTTPASIRQYLESHWNFKQGLQDHCLLHAIASQPSSRLASEPQTHSFLDDIAGSVLKTLGVDPALFTSSGSGSGSGGNALASIPVEALQELQGDQREHDKRLLDLYAKRCGIDIMDGSHIIEKQRIIDELQARIDAWAIEHSDEYEKGIQSKFDALKSRTYDSSWNWVIEDLVSTFAQILSGKPTITNTQRFTTRMTTKLVEVVTYLQQTLKAFPESSSKTQAETWLRTLQVDCEMAKGHPQPFRFSAPSAVPILSIDDEGKISVREIPRNIANISRDSNSPAGQRPDQSDSASDAGSMSSADSTMACSEMFSAVGGPNQSRFGLGTSIATSVVSDSVAGPTSHDIDLPDLPNLPIPTPGNEQHPHMPSLKIKTVSGFERHSALTQSYLQWFNQAASTGISFAEKYILVTGAGKNSIGAEVVKHLLSASAKVLVTTSSYSPETIAFYEALYKEHGGAFAKLIVVPFNAASMQDVHNLVAYMYDTLGWDVDHVVPFAAIGEGGRDISELDARSELAHRAMLTNVLRLLGCIKDAKVIRGLDTHPTQVILPLSPNHGGFGNDGLYAESKIGLEALLHKQSSESWSDYLTVCGAVIGWVRGTNLMGGNDVAATGIEEELHIRTYAQPEMAWHIVGLMDPRISDECEVGPVVADLTGGMTEDMDMRKAVDDIKESIKKRSELRKALALEAAMENDNQGIDVAPEKLEQRARIKVNNDDTRLPTWSEIEPLHELLEGMVDLERVVVVVGFGEAGK